MGRKSLPDDERRDYKLQVKLNAAEQKLVEDASAEAYNGEQLPGRGVTSTWAREVLVEAAKRKLKKTR